MLSFCSFSMSSSAKNLQSTKLYVTNSKCGLQNRLTVFFHSTETVSQTGIAPPLTNTQNLISHCPSHWSFCISDVFSKLFLSAFTHSSHKYYWSIIFFSDSRLECLPVWLETCSLTYILTICQLKRDSLLKKTRQLSEMVALSEIVPKIH